MNDETSGKTFDQVLYAAFKEGFSQGITNIADGSLDKSGAEARTRGRFDDWRRNVLAGAPTSDDVSTDRVGVVGGVPGAEQSGVSTLREPRKTTLKLKLGEPEPAFKEPGEAMKICANVRCKKYSEVVKPTHTHKFGKAKKRSKR